MEPKRDVAPLIRRNSVVLPLGGRPPWTPPKASGIIAQRHARDPPRVVREVRLVEVTRIGGRGGERGPGADEPQRALEPQDPLERLRPVPERGEAPPPELPLA